MDFATEYTEKVLKNITWLQHLPKRALKELTSIDKINHGFIWSHIIQDNESKITVFKEMLKSTRSVTHRSSPVHHLFPDKYINESNFLGVLDDDIASEKKKIEMLDTGPEKDRLLNYYTVHSIVRAACKWSMMRSAAPRYKIVRDIVSAANETGLQLRLLFKKPELLEVACEGSPELALVLLLTLTQEKQVTSQTTFMRLLIIACDGAVRGNLMKPSVERAKTAMKNYVELCASSSDPKVAELIGASDTVAKSESVIDMLKNVSRKATQQGCTKLSDRVDAVSEALGGEDPTVEMMQLVLSNIKEFGFKESELAIRGHLCKHMEMKENK